MTELLYITEDGDHFIVPVEGRTLDALQTLVGGLVDVVSTQWGECPVDVWVNDEGLLNGMPFNMFASAITKRQLCGPAVVAACNADGETISVPSILLQHIADLGIAAQVMPPEAAWQTRCQRMGV